MVDDIKEEVTIPAANVLEGLPEETLVEAGRVASKLMNDDKFINATWHCIVANHQVHQLLMAGLSRRIEQLGRAPEVHQIIMRSARHHSAGKEFTRDGVIRKVAEHLTPWLLADLEEEKVREVKIRKEDFESEEALRKQVPIPLPFRFGREWFQKEGHDPQLSRDRTLSVAGHPLAVKLVLDAIQQHALAVADTEEQPRLAVLRCVASMRQHNVIRKKGDPGVQQFEVGVNRWLHCARSLKVVLETFAPFVSQLDRSVVDLTIVDDLSQAVEPGASTAPELLAGRAQKLFRKWADAANCALVVGVPLQVELLDDLGQVKLNKSEWTQLEVYTTLIMLRVELADGCYSIFARRHNDPADEIAILTGVDKTIIELPQGGSPNGA